MDAVQTHDWHAHRPPEVLDILETSEHGLTSAEAQVRLSVHGPNTLPATAARHPLFRFLEQFNNALIYFLLAAALAAFVLGHAVDAAVIIVVVLVNAIVGFIQEGKAEQALDAMQSMIAPHTRLLRNGQRQEIAIGEVVPGDIVHLEAGDRIPADVRLLETHGLLVDEAPLTGESVAAEKHHHPVDTGAALGDRRSMAFSGTLVAAGQGVGVVVETGTHTQIGRISRMLQSVERLTTPLLRQIDSFARRCTAVVFIGSLLLFLFAVFVRDFAWPDALIAVVAVAVGVVPEGLPAVITITLAIGVRRMAARNAVIRKLPAVETLGATSVICTDKTGTLTRNEMIVRRMVTADRTFIVSGTGYAPEGGFTLARGEGDAAALAAADPIVLCGALCNDADLRPDGSADGDPMEAALVSLALKAGLDHRTLRAEWKQAAKIPFDAAYRFMATLRTAPDGEAVAFVKGAPEALFAMAEDGFDSALWAARVAEAGAQGERVLAFGMKRMPPGCRTLHFDDLADGVTLLGIMGFIDPPRPEAVSAITQCRSAGIAVKMITGDHAATALAIARQIDLADDPEVITGAELDALPEDQLAATVRRVSVFARTNPEHKLRIVRALQASGAIVAMTGDGVNDAPSLKQADVGTAMGHKGTDVAKEAAEMVLLDDNFASIVNAVYEGRTVYDNIRKVISWTIPTNGGEAVAVIIAILAGFAMPMTATQILWINLVLSATLGLVLAFEPPEPGIMRRPPRAADAPLLSPFLLWRVIVVSLLLTAAALGIFFYGLAAGRDLETARTMVVNMLIVAEIFYLFNVRYLHMTSITWRGALGTPSVLAAIAVVVVAQLLFTYAPFMNALFESRPLGLVDGMLIIAIGTALMMLLEGEKIVLRKLGWFEELKA